MTRYIPAILLALLLAVPARAVDLSSYRRPQMPQRITIPAGAVVVRYEVESDRGANITHQLAGATEQREVGPGTKTLAFAAFPGEFLYLSAQNKDDRGDVACRIYVAGELVQRATSDAAYGIASCSSQVPR